MTKIRFEIEGEPMGKQRPKVTVLGTSRYAHAYTPKETVNYESKVVYCFNNAVKEQFGTLEEKTLFRANEELIATITAYFKIPKSCYRFHKKTGTLDLTPDGQLMKSGAKNPTKKPDCDNIAKIVLDALNGIAFPDDSQVSVLCVGKRYSERPRVEVELLRVSPRGETDVQAE